MARWLDLTRRQLPAAAHAHHWPIRLDHCFMRVCLDAAVGRPWYEVIRRPAVQHASDEHLQRAVAIAEAALADPASLPARNIESLRMRGKAGYGKDGPPARNKLAHKGLAGRSVRRKVAPRGKAAIPE